MGKKKDDLFQEYIRRLTDAGIYDEKLIPQIRQAAQTEAMLNDMMNEQMQKPYSTFETNTRGMPSMVASPLLAHIAKFQSVLINQLRAIGLNYDATPTKMTELPKGNNAGGGSGLGALLAQGAPQAFRKRPNCSGE